MNHPSIHPTKLSTQSGVTIAEFLIAVAIAGVILAQVCLLWLYSSRSFAAQMNYTDLDQRSQRALDTLTQDIRQCKSVTNFTTTRVTFIDYDNKLLTFFFDSGKLIRTKAGVPSKTLLKDCISGEFSMYQRTPIAGSADIYPTSDPKLCKLVQVRWTCGRKLSPTSPTTSESMQSGRIVMRVK
ncbi:MAG TPA: hypothetical protein VJ063_12055 [Verrucomicrobiae bacterium]|nr:hypothetical protein [Verrucomicrobiae bacterium]